MITNQTNQLPYVEDEPTEPSPVRLDLANDQWIQCGAISPTWPIFKTASGPDFLGRPMNTLLLPYPYVDRTFPEEFLRMLLEHCTNFGPGRWVMSVTPSNRHPSFAYRMDIPADLSPEDFEKALNVIEHQVIFLREDVALKLKAKLAA